MEAGTRKSSGATPLATGNQQQRQHQPPSDDLRHGALFSSGKIEPTDINKNSNTPLTTPLNTEQSQSSPSTQITSQPLMPVSASNTIGAVLGPTPSPRHDKGGESTLGLNSSLHRTQQLFSRQIADENVVYNQSPANNFDRSQKGQQPDEHNNYDRTTSKNTNNVSGLASITQGAGGSSTSLFRMKRPSGRMSAVVGHEVSGGAGPCAKSPSLSSNGGLHSPRQRLASCSPPVPVDVREMLARVRSRSSGSSNSNALLDRSASSSPFEAGGGGGAEPGVGEGPHLLAVVPPLPAVMASFPPFSTAAGAAPKVLQHPLGALVYNQQQHQLSSPIYKSNNNESPAGLGAGEGLGLGLVGVTSGAIASGFDGPLSSSPQRPNTDLVAAATEGAPLPPHIAMNAADAANAVNTTVAAAPAAVGSGSALPSSSYPRGGAVHWVGIGGGDADGDDPLLHLGPFVVSASSIATHQQQHLSQSSGFPVPVVVVNEPTFYQRPALPHSPPTAPTIARTISAAQVEQNMTSSQQPPQTHFTSINAKGTGSALIAVVGTSPTNTNPNLGARRNESFVSPQPSVLGGLGGVGGGTAGVSTTTSSVVSLHHLYQSQTPSARLSLPHGLGSVGGVGVGATFASMFRASNGNSNSSHSGVDHVWAQLEMIGGGGGAYTHPNSNTNGDSNPREEALGTIEDGADNSGGGGVLVHTGLLIGRQHAPVAHSNISKGAAGGAHHANLPTINTDGGAKALAVAVDEAQLSPSTASSAALASAPFRDKQQQLPHMVSHPAMLWGANPPPVGSDCPHPMMALALQANAQKGHANSLSSNATPSTQPTTALQSHGISSAVPTTAATSAATDDVAAAGANHSHNHHNNNNNNVSSTTQHTIINGGVLSPTGLQAALQPNINTSFTTSLTTTPQLGPLQHDAPLVAPTAAVAVAVAAANSTVLTVMSMGPSASAEHNFVNILGMGGAGGESLGMSPDWVPVVSDSTNPLAIVGNHITSPNGASEAGIGIGAGRGASSSALHTSAAGTSGSITKEGLLAPVVGGEVTSHGTNHHQQWRGPLQPPSSSASPTAVGGGDNSGVGQHASVLLSNTHHRHSFSSSIGGGGGGAASLHQLSIRQKLGDKGVTAFVRVSMAAKVHAIAGGGAPFSSSPTNTLSGGMLSRQETAHSAAHSRLSNANPQAVTSSATSVNNNNNTSTSSRGGGGGGGGGAVVWNIGNAANSLSPPLSPQRTPPHTPPRSPSQQQSSINPSGGYTVAAIGAAIALNTHALSRNNSTAAGAATMATSGPQGLFEQLLIQQQQQKEQRDQMHFLPPTRLYGWKVMARADDIIMKYIPDEEFAKHNDHYTDMKRSASASAAPSLSDPADTASLRKPSSSLSPSSSHHQRSAQSPTTSAPPPQQHLTQTNLNTIAAAAAPAKHATAFVSPVRRRRGDGASTSASMTAASSPLLPMSSSPPASHVVANNTSNSPPAAKGTLMVPFYPYGVEALGGTIDASLDVSSALLMMSGRAASFSRIGISGGGAGGGGPLRSASASQVAGSFAFSRHRSAAGNATMGHSSRRDQHNANNSPERVTGDVNNANKPASPMSSTASRRRNSNAAHAANANSKSLAMEPSDGGPPPPSIPPIPFSCGEKALVFSLRYCDMKLVGRIRGGCDGSVGGSGGGGGGVGVVSGGGGSLYLLNQPSNVPLLSTGPTHDASSTNQTNLPHHHYASGGGTSRTPPSMGHIEASSAASFVTTSLPPSMHVGHQPTQPQHPLQAFGALLNNNNNNNTINVASPSAVLSGVMSFQPSHRLPAAPETLLAPLSVSAGGGVAIGEDLKSFTAPTASLVAFPSPFENNNFPPILNATGNRVDPSVDILQIILASGHEVHIEIPPKNADALALAEAILEGRHFALARAGGGGGGGGGVGLGLGGTLHQTVSFVGASRLGSDAASTTTSFSVGGLVGLGGGGHQAVAPNYYQQQQHLNQQRSLSNAGMGGGFVSSGPLLTANSNITSPTSTNYQQNTTHAAFNGGAAHSSGGANTRSNTNTSTTGNSHTPPVISPVLIPNHLQPHAQIPSELVIPRPLGSGESGSGGVGVGALNNNKLAAGTIGGDAFGNSISTSTTTTTSTSHADTHHPSNVRCLGPTVLPPLPARSASPSPMAASLATNANNALLVALTSPPLLPLGGAHPSASSVHTLAGGGGSGAAAAAAPPPPLLGNGPYSTTTPPRGGEGGLNTSSSAARTTEREQHLSTTAGAHGSSTLTAAPFPHHASHAVNPAATLAGRLLPSLLAPTTAAAPSGDAVSHQSSMASDRAKESATDKKAAPRLSTHQIHQIQNNNNNSSSSLPAMLSARGSRGARLPSLFPVPASANINHNGKVQQYPSIRGEGAEINNGSGANNNDADGHQGVRVVGGKEGGFAIGAQPTLAFSANAVATRDANRNGGSGSGSGAREEQKAMARSSSPLRQGSNAITRRQEEEGREDSSDPIVINGDLLKDKDNSAKIRRKSSVGGFLASSETINTNDAGADNSSATPLAATVGAGVSSNNAIPNTSANAAAGALLGASRPQPVRLSAEALAAANLSYATRPLLSFSGLMGSSASTTSRGVVPITIAGGGASNHNNNGGRFSTSANNNNNNNNNNGGGSSSAANVSRMQSGYLSQSNSTHTKDAAVRGGPSGQNGSGSGSGSGSSPILYANSASPPTAIGPCAPPIVVPFVPHPMLKTSSSPPLLPVFQNNGLARDGAMETQPMIATISSGSNANATEEDTSPSVLKFKQVATILSNQTTSGSTLPTNPTLSPPTKAAEQQHLLLHHTAGVQTSGEGGGGKSSGTCANVDVRHVNMSDGDNASIAAVLGGGGRKGEFSTAPHQQGGAFPQLNNIPSSPTAHTRPIIPFAPLLGPDAAGGPLLQNGGVTATAIVSNATSAPTNKQMPSTGANDNALPLPPPLAASSLRQLQPPPPPPFIQQRQSSIQFVESAIDHEASSSCASSLMIASFNAAAGGGVRRRIPLTNKTNFVPNVNGNTATAAAVSVGVSMAPTAPSTVGDDVNTHCSASVMDNNNAANGYGKHGEDEQQTTHANNDASCLTRTSTTMTNLTTGATVGNTSRVGFHANGGGGGGAEDGSGLSFPRWSSPLAGGGGRHPVTTTLVGSGAGGGGGGGSPFSPASSGHYRVEVPSSPTRSRNTAILPPCGAASAGQDVANRKEAGSPSSPHRGQPSAHQRGGLVGGLSSVPFLVQSPVGLLSNPFAPPPSSTGVVPIASAGVAPPQPAGVGAGVARSPLRRRVPQFHLLDQQYDVTLALMAGAMGRQGLPAGMPPPSSAHAHATVGSPTARGGRLSVLRPSGINNTAALGGSQNNNTTANASMVAFSPLRLRGGPNANNNGGVSSPTGINRSVSGFGLVGGVGSFMSLVSEHPHASSCVGGSPASFRQSVNAGTRGERQQEQQERGEEGSEGSVRKDEVVHPRLSQQKPAEEDKARKEDAAATSAAPETIKASRAEAHVKPAQHPLHPSLALLEPAPTPSRSTHRVDGIDALEVESQKHSSGGGGGANSNTLTTMATRSTEETQPSAVPAASPASAERAHRLLPTASSALASREVLSTPQHQHQHQHHTTVVAFGSECV